MARKARPQTGDEVETTFPKKFLKLLPDGFMEEMASATPEDVKLKILESSKYAYDVEQERDADEKLTAAKEVVKDLGAGYKEALKTLEAKIKYCSFELKSRG